MSVEGIIRQISRKSGVSAKGRDYTKTRVCVDDGSGEDKWFTTFIHVPDELKGARCTLDLEDTDYGPKITEISVLEAAAVPDEGATVPAEPAAGSARGGGHRDMWIAMESFYQHAIAHHGTDNDLYMPGSPSHMRATAFEAMRLAIIANETFKAYDADGVVAARKILRAAASPDSDPVSKVEDLADRAAIASSRASAAESDELSTQQSQDHDDDIPF
jgi:hypothetical protein